MNLISTIKSLFSYFTLYAGGGGSSAPTQQNVTQTSIPEYARPYVETALGKTAALTDINQNPYQPYQGQQVAGFSPLQTQGMQGIAGQQVAPQLQAATDLATRSGQGGLQAFDTSGQLQNQSLGYGAQGANLGILGGGLYGGQAAQSGSNYANLATSPGAVSSYMSPYMQNAVDVQKQEAIRDYQKTMPVLGAQAVKSGAFGGSRQAIVDAEAQRNVNQQLANIQATGSQQAYDKAMQSMQFGSNLGLQGLQTGLQGVNTQLAGTGQGLQGVQGAVGAGQYGLAGLGTTGQAASTLGALGQTQFGQEMAINQAQMQAGALQQAQEQRGLDIGYQQYQDQLNYPYKQLAFQSDMFRGLPLNQSAQTMYQNTGAMAPQLLGAGIAAYGASTRAKNGGMVKSYAEGGMTTVDPSVPSSIGPQALSSRLAKLSDEQLMAYARTVKDAVALAEVRGEIQRRQEAREPQGQMPTGTVAQSMAPEEAPQVPVMAGGGIVALSGGGTGDQSGFRQDAQATLAKRESDIERQKLIAKDGLEAGPLGYFISSADKRAQAQARIRELQAATPEELQSYASSGMMPQVQYGADEGRPVSPMLAANAVSSAAKEAQAQDVDSQVNTGQISPQQLEEMTAAANREDMAERQVQDADSQVQSQVAGAAPSVSPNAPPGTVPGGIVPSRAPVAGAPAAPTASTGIVPSSKAPVAMAGGAIPIANPGDPMGWGAYKASVEDASKLDPEQKAVLDDMRKRSERKMSRAERQEKNVASETTIAMGIAMMRGLNISDGIQRMATEGGKKYFESSAEARKAIETADDAQSAFDQYQLSLKQGNKKVAAEMYGKFHNSMMDFNGKIQAASIGAAASRENAQATREATEAYRKDQIEQRNLDRDALMQRHTENISAREGEFKARMEQEGNTKMYQQMQLLDGRQRDLMAERRLTEKAIYDRYASQIDQIRMAESAGKPLSEALRRQKSVIETQINAELREKLAPINKQLEDVVLRKGEMMNIPAPSSSGGFKIVGVRQK